MRMLAIGLVAAATVAVAAPAVAEDFYVGGRDGGIGVDVESGYRRHHDRDRDFERDRTTGFERREGRDARGCTTTIVREDGMVRKIRRCRD